MVSRRTWYRHAARRRHNKNQPLEEPGGSHEGSNNEAEESGEDGVPSDQATRIFQDHDGDMEIEYADGDTYGGIHHAHGHFPYLEGGAGNPGCERDID